MWFLGLVLGAIAGAPFGGSAAFAGAAVGLFFGIVAGWLRTGLARPAETDNERWRLFDQKLTWLYEETQRLRKEVEGLKNAGGVAAEAATPASAEAEIGVPGVETGRIGDRPRFYEAQNRGLSPILPASADPVHLVPPLAEPVMPEEAAEPSWMQNLLAGNLLAKIGVILLFFGVASALRLAADYGLFPVQLRLLLGAVAGVVMVGFGWNKVREGAHRAFGIAVQGGGFAILYLIVYFMLARYELLGATPAFALFALLGLACVLMAAAQDGVALAVFGMAGAFFAPVLAARGGGDPLPLFAYFTLLNGFMIGVSWFRAWRALNVAGFFLTLGVGVAWGVEHYHAGHYAVTQGFLLFFWALYSLTPVLTACFRAPGWRAWSDGTLVFGTPLIGFALQSQLLTERIELGWAAFAIGLYYLALWALLFRRNSEDTRLLERCQLGLAIAFGTLAVPLAFGAQVTAAFWALEGVAVLWFGVAQNRRLAMAAGALLQLAAGAWFAGVMTTLQTRMPVLNDICLGMAMLAAAGYVSARLLRGRSEVAAVAALFWAMLWWLAAGLTEIDRLTAPALGVPLALLFVTATLAALELVGRLLPWPAPRHFGLLLLLALWSSALGSLLRADHALPGLMAIALPLGLAVHLWQLRRQEEDGIAFWAELRHLGAFWLVLALVSVELAWVGHRLAPGVLLWPALALAVGPVLGLWLARVGVERAVYPFSAQASLYTGIASALPATLLMIWFVWANFFLSGGGSGLPYLPVLNPQDIVLLAVLLALRGWLKHFDAGAGAVRWLWALAFLWLSCLAARIAHHWGGVPFNKFALWHSGLLQAMLTFLWTLAAIAAMIVATRIGRRRLWQGGFALLAVVGAKLLFIDLANAGTVVWTASLIGVALLVLAAGYFAPAPPEEKV